MPYGLRTSVLVLLAAGVLGWAVPRRFFRDIAAALRTISRRPKIVLALIWIVALVPMVLHTVRVRHYSVNAPTFDDWAMAPLILKAHSGQLRFADVFQQQQEARTVLPNLIFVLTSRTEWNVRDQMMLSLIASWLTAGGLFVLLRRLRLNLLALAISFWLIVLTLFAPGPFELWLFASGFPSFLPLLFLVTALIAIGARISILWKFLICLMLATASTFTLAHGLLAWGLTFPVLLVSQRIPRWRSWLVAWLTMAAVCATAYLWGYQKPAYLPGFAPAVPVLDYVSFILQFLGSGLAYAVKSKPAVAATTFALVEIGLLLAAAWYCFRRSGESGLWRASVPWFALALFAGATAFLAALGRVGFGVAYALSSRYVPFSLGLTLAVIALTALVLADLAKRKTTGRSRLPLVIAIALLVASYLVPYKIAAGNTLFFLRGYAASDHLAKSALLFSQAFDTSSAIKAKVFPPAPDYVVRNAAALDDLKLLRPRLVRSNSVGALPHEQADGTRAAGLCEQLSETADVYRATGWAVLKEKRRTADCVVISYALPGAEPVLFAISESFELRWDIARTNWPNDYLWAGWTATFPRAAVPPNAELAFWAVDADGPRLYRLGRKVR